MLRFTLWVCLLVNAQSLFAQSGVVEGRVYDKVNNDPIPFANVIIKSTSTGASTNEEGYYRIENLKPGEYNLQASFIGYNSKTIFEVEVSNSRTARIDFGLEEKAEKLKEVEVVASGFEKTAESPVSLRSIGVNEIKRSPGGNRDISRVVRSLPGVASTPSFRNDIIIRGGAPSENKYFLDGLEVPNINHFQTQGSSGGPVGLINVDFIKRVDFYSGAFPANRGNTLSSVFDFIQKDGREDRLAMNAIVGASDLGITLEGPVTDQSTFIASARRSYLQFLFDIFNLPFLPIYNDFQFKYKHKFDNKNQLSIIGLGAIDDFRLNEDAPEKAESEDEREEAEYILNAIPVSDQWNYTIGAKFEHFRDNGYYTFVVSRNMLNNTSIKYSNNDSSDPDNLLTDYLSQEIENKIRVEDYILTDGKYTINYGINYEFARYYVDEFSKIVTQSGNVVRDYESDISLHKYGLFGQVSKDYFGDKLSLSFGFRMDANGFSEEMNNPFDQFSPRFSASYQILPRVSFNFNTGIYYQLPPYTVLGFRNDKGDLVNKENGVRYISNRHVVAGVEYEFDTNSRISVEGFYKKYVDYPFLVRDSISLANLGADFGVIGNAPVVPASEGRSYGVEFLAQQKLFKGFYGLLAYTFVVSEFTDKNGQYVPSSWDNRHLVSLTGGKKFDKNWEVGIRWLFTGNQPFTPYDVDQTVRKENWDIRGFAVPDFDRLNEQRTDAYHQLDIRVDKKYYFDKWNLNVYLDIQNVYNFVLEQQRFIDVVRDESGNPVTDPERPAYYQPKFIDNESGTILPTIGIIVEI